MEKDLASRIKLLDDPDYDLPFILSPVNEVYTSTGRVPDPANYSTQISEEDLAYLDLEMSKEVEGQKRAQTPISIFIIGVLLVFAIPVAFSSYSLIPALMSVPHVLV